jgi:hypothetical protein
MIGTKTIASLLLSTQLGLAAPAYPTPRLGADVTVTFAQGAELKAPALPSWPEGLPDAKSLDDGSVLLPKELADALLQRLRILESYPAACQVRMDTNRELYQAEIDLLNAQMAAKNPTWWSRTWPLLLGVVGGAALGVGLGL